MRKNPDYSYPGYADGRMVRGFLYNLERDAKELQKLITDDDQLPQWVSWKIYTAEDRLGAAARYMKREVLQHRAPNPARSNPPDTNQKKALVILGLFAISGYILRSR